MALAIDTQTIQKAQRQHTIDLLDQLTYISTTLKEIREQRHLLFVQRQILHEQQQALFAQRQALYIKESTLLQEESAIVAQLSCLRGRGE